MTTAEQDALIQYLEFTLVKFVESMEQHIDPDAVGLMYDNAYRLLNDLDFTLDVQCEIDAPPAKIH